MPTRTDDAVRREIEAERERLAQAVESLRKVDVKRKLRRVGLGVLTVGGIGVAARSLLRRGRE
jgi:hypothetical protein